MGYPDLTRRKIIGALAFLDGSDAPIGPRTRHLILKVPVVFWLALTAGEPDISAQCCYGRFPAAIQANKTQPVRIITRPDVRRPQNGIAIDAQAAILIHRQQAC